MSEAKEVLFAEARINAIELEVDGLAIDLLALHQPMASNLRFIIATLKINSNLERMGDLFVVIAHSAMSLIDIPPIEAMVDTRLWRDWHSPCDLIVLDCFQVSASKQEKNFR